MRFAVGVLGLFLAVGVAAGAAQSPEAAQPGSVATAQAEPRPRDSRITAEETRKLLQEVDRILRWVSAETGLPIKHPVKPEMASAEQVREYVRERMAEDEDAQRIRDSQLVLKKLGLLPRQFDFEKFLIQLYGEQVAGFYDFKKKTIYLVDWVEPAARESVLAHELTHALQDQDRDLEKWMKEARDLGERSRTQKSSPGLVDSDEHISARSAVTEGQGMVVLLDYGLKKQGRDIKDSPGLVKEVQAGMHQRGTSPVFDSAPLLLREAIVFPYSYGLGFIHAVLVKSGTEGAFRGTLNNPPRNTHQVLYPESYFAGRSVEPIVLPDMAKLLSGKYDELDAGSVGQFDVQVMFKEYAGDAAAERLTPQWKGGVYYAARRRSAGKKTAPASASVTEPIALMYLSRWASPEAAEEAAAAYAQGLRRRYDRVQANELSGSATARSGYDTSEGPVRIWRRGEMLLITEGFDEQTAAELRSAVEGAPAKADVPQGAILMGDDLAFRAMPRGLEAAQRALLHRQALAALGRAGVLR